MGKNNVKIEVKSKNNKVKNGVEVASIIVNTEKKGAIKTTKKAVVDKTLYMLTHREVDQRSRTVAYHLVNRRGTRYRVEKPLMIEMVGAGTVKGVTLREVSGETQVIGIGTSVGLFPRVLNLSEMPVRALNVKEARDAQDISMFNVGNDVDDNGIIMEVGVFAKEVSKDKSGRDVKGYVF
jgi:hypothetical protein